MPSRALASTRSLDAQEGIACRRLASQHLGRGALADPAAVVARLGAVQAQDYHGAKWAVGQRTRGATDATVERAFDQGAILRTHVLRPTWHFVAPADIRWMLRLTAPRVRQAMAYYNRILELTPAVFRRGRAAIERALRGGRHLTRLELAAALRGARVGPVHTQRLAHLLMEAELDGLVCSGPRRGKQFTYALLDERVPDGSLPGAEDALAELARRYFATRGPATPADFAWWSGLTVGEARRAVDLLGRAAEQETVDGVPYVSLPADAPAPLRSPAAFLLPNYDEFFIGHKDRRAIGRRLARTAGPKPADAMFMHVLVLDGQLVGDWRRLDEGHRRVVRLRVMAKLSRVEERALASAVQRYAAFLGAPLAVDRL